MKKIGKIPCCRECPLRIHRRTFSGCFKSFCVGNKDPFNLKHSYYIRIHHMLITGLELTDLSIIHPDCPLEDDNE